MPFSMSQQRKRLSIRSGPSFPALTRSSAFCEIRHISKSCLPVSFNTLFAERACCAILDRRFPNPGNMSDKTGIRRWRIAFLVYFVSLFESSSTQERFFALAHEAQFFTRQGQKRSSHPCFRIAQQFRSLCHRIHASQPGNSRTPHQVH